MADPTHYLWLDLETTGLSKPVPQPDGVEQDDIDLPIEIGCVMTNRLLEKHGQFVRLIDWPGMSPSDWPDAVFDMHSKSGLFADFAKHRGNPKACGKVAEVEEVLIDWMVRCGHQTGHTALAGSGVAHFDQFFLHRFMPRLMGELHHAIIDVGVLRRLSASASKQLPDAMTSRPTRPHRALDDARASLSSAHRWVSGMAQIQP